MMKRLKIFMMCAVLGTMTLCLAACGGDTEKPPYEDETQSGTDKNNNNNNNNNNGDTGNMGEDIKNGVDNIGDDIQNGVDNLENGIQNGIDNVEDGMNDIQNNMDNPNNPNDNNRTNNRDMSGGMSRLEEAGNNLMNSIREARAAIEEGFRQISAQ